MTYCIFRDNCLWPFSWHIILIIELKNVGKDGGSSGRSVINGCEFEFLWHIFISFVHLLCPLGLYACGTQLFILKSFENEYFNFFTNSSLNRPQAFSTSSLITFLSPFLWPFRKKSLNFETFRDQNKFKSTWKPFWPTFSLMTPA